MKRLTQADAADLCNTSHEVVNRELTCIFILLFKGAVCKNLTPVY